MATKEVKVRHLTTHKATAQSARHFLSSGLMTGRSLGRRSIVHIWHKRGKPMHETSAIARSKKKLMHAVLPQQSERLFSRLELVTSTSQWSNFTVTPGPPLKAMVTLSSKNEHRDAVNNTLADYDMFNIVFKFHGHQVNYLLMFPSRRCYVPMQKMNNALAYRALNKISTDKTTFQLIN